MGNTIKKIHKRAVTHEDKENVCREDKISIRWAGGVWFKLGDRERRSTPPRLNLSDACLGSDWCLGGGEELFNPPAGVLWVGTTSHKTLLSRDPFFIIFFLPWTIRAGVSHYIDIWLCLFSKRKHWWRNFFPSILSVFWDGMCHTTLKSRACDAIIDFSHANKIIPQYWNSFIVLN